MVVILREGCCVIWSGTPWTSINQELRNGQGDRPEPAAVKAAPPFSRLMIERKRRFSLESARYMGLLIIYVPLLLALFARTRAALIRACTSVVLADCIAVFFLFLYESTGLPKYEWMFLFWFFCIATLVASIGAFCGLGARAINNWLAPRRWQRTVFFLLVGCAAAIATLLLWLVARPRQ